LYRGNQWDAATCATGATTMSQFFGEAIMPLKKPIKLIVPKRE